MRIYQQFSLLQNGTFTYSKKLVREEWIKAISEEKTVLPLNEPHNERATGAEESADTLEGPRGDCKAYQKCISTIFDNFGGKINQKMVVSNYFVVA